MIVEKRTLLTFPYQNPRLYIQRLIDIERKSLHPSLRNYVEPICLLFAGKYRIRIDLMHDGNIRYSSWKKDAATSDIPDLVIYGGKRWGNRWGTSVHSTSTTR